MARYLLLWLLPTSPCRWIALSGSVGDLSTTSVCPQRGTHRICLTGALIPCYRCPGNNQCRGILGTQNGRNYRGVFSMSYFTCNTHFELTSAMYWKIGLFKNKLGYKSPIYGKGAGKKKQYSKNKCLKSNLLFPICTWSK